MIDDHNSFDEALRFYSAGDLRQAEVMCGDMLSCQPGFSDAWHLRGLIAMTSKQHDVAEDYFIRAININPDKYIYYYDLGNVFAVKGLLKNASECYAKAIDLNPGFSDAYNNMGSIFLSMGLKQDAIQYYRKAVALHPDDSISLFNLGNLLADTGKTTEAIECYQKAIDLNPADHNYYNNMGVVLAAENMTNEAVDNFKKALLLNPDWSKPYTNLGKIYSDLGMIEDAIENYRQALALRRDSSEAYNDLAAALNKGGREDEAIECALMALINNHDSAKAYNNLGISFSEKGMLGEAIENFKKALSLKSDYAEAYDNIAVTYNNLGISFSEKGMLGEAIENFKKALSLKSDYAAAYNNLAFAFKDKGMLDAAINNYKIAVELNPCNAEMHNSLAMAYLLAKDFDNGWEEYEWRLKAIKVAPLTKPAWDGSPPNNRVLLVYAEQGYGDALQFCRYLPLLKDLGAGKVLFKPNNKGLEQLLKGSDLKAEILDADTPVDTLEFDTNIHLMSLPRIFRTDLENIPFKQKRYLKADPEKVEKYREKIFRTQDSRFKIQPLKIGISWQGSPTFIKAGDKAVPLSYFYPLCRLSGVKVYSLQKGHGIEQLSGLPEDIEITNLGESFNDFSDTAAAIENLDMVITIDTAVAHLSGALGKKTWILLPAYAEWRWLMDISYSPWYEDVRLFRHREPGKKDWEEMMERVEEQVKVEIIQRGENGGGA